MSKKTELVNRVIADIRDRPKDFVREERVLLDMLTRRRYWIATGFWFYAMHDPIRDAKFGFWGRVRFGLVLRQYFPKRDWKTDRQVEALALWEGPS